MVILIATSFLNEFKINTKMTYKITHFIPILFSSYLCNFSFSLTYWIERNKIYIYYLLDKNHYLEDNFMGITNLVS